MLWSSNFRFEYSVWVCEIYVALACLVHFLVEWAVCSIKNTICVFVKDFVCTRETNVICDNHGENDIYDMRQVPSFQTSSLVGFQCCNKYILHCVTTKGICDLLSRLSSHLASCFVNTSLSTTSWKIVYVDYFEF